MQGFGLDFWAMTFYVYDDVQALNKYVHLCTLVNVD